MSFEDDMLEAGFNDENEYLESLCAEAEERQDYIRRLDHNESRFSRKSSIDRNTLFQKRTDGLFVSGAPWLYSRKESGHLRVGNIIRGPRINYLEPNVFFDLPEVYTESENFENGIARCFRDGIWGLINARFEEVFFSTECDVEKSLNISGIKFFVTSSTFRVNGRNYTYKGLLDGEGRTIIPPVFGNITDGGKGQISFFPGSFMFSIKDNKTFPLDKVLEILHSSSSWLDWDKEPWPEQLVPYCNDVRAIMKNGLIGVEDRSHNIIIDCAFEEVSLPTIFYDHAVPSLKREVQSRCLITAYNNGLCCCFDLKGNLVKRFPENTFVYDESTGISVRRNYLYASLTDSETGWYYTTDAMVDTDGSLIVQDDDKRYVRIPSIYDWAVCVLDENDEPNYIEVLQNGKYGLIDESLKVIVPCVYDLIGGMFFHGFNSDGLMSVKRDGKYGVINNRWEEVIPCIHDKPQV